MADNLIFPIGFDLDKGIKEAIEQGDKGLKRLEAAISKHPITVKVKLDTGRTRGTQSELVGFKKQLAELTQEWNKLTAAERGGAAGAALRERYRALQREAQGYVSTLRAAVSQEDKLAAARDKAARAAERGTTATRNANREFHNQDGYISRLIKRLAVYASFSAVNNFLTSVREVTAQFELQRVSLGAIIQDQTRANALFSEIKQFALKSPISIMDLTKYTKQVAAYRIETDKLFDTTKRLADVSVGLGADMGRLVLAFGQVKAASYLRAAEIRQFTEAGIPMLELLAEKFTKLNGEAVTTEQVMEMVSKRMVGFEMVEDIFNDMTSAGGMFYNMQEKQGNTLFGLWAKLGDAASVMYDEIGNTESVNSGMKDLIQLLTDLMRNWQMVARGMSAAGLVIAGLVVKKKILALEIAKVDAIQRTYNARMVKANALASANSRLVRAQGVAMGVYATAMRTASTVAAAFGTSLRAIKSALVTTGWGALLVALGYIVDKLFLTQSAAEKAAEAIDKIASETVTEQNKSVRNFEYLANAAVNAADGSRKQREALDELQRTYKDILPSEVLELEYLKQLKGNYDSLTMSIRQYVAEQQRRKMLDEISNVYGAEKLKYERKLTDFFESDGWSEQEIARFWEHFYSIAGDKSKSLEQVVAESMRKAGRNGIADAMKLLKNQRSLTKGIDKDSYKAIGLTVVGKVDYIDMLRDAVLEENKALERSEERSRAAAEAAKAFAEAQEKSAEKVKNATIKMGGKSVDRDSYIGNQAIKNLQIKELTKNLKDGFEQAGLEWDASFGNFIDKINASKPELISSLNFDAIINSITEALKNPKLTDEQRNFLTQLLSFAQQSKEAYAEIIPSDPVVRTWQQRFKQIAQAAGGFRKEYNQYLIKAGEDLKTYNGRLKISLEGLKNNVKGLLATQKLVVKAGIFAKLLYGVSAEELQKKIDEANKEIDVIEKTLAEQPNFDKESNRSGGRKSDNRLSILQEMVSTLKQANKEYDELAKKEGATKALADAQEKYDKTFKRLQSLATKYDFNLPDFGVPTDAESLTKYLEAIGTAMAKLPKSDRAVLQLEMDVADIKMNDTQKKIDAKLKQLSDRISRTKTAREFYEKILNQTGDIDLAAHVTLSIYGDTGEGLFDDTVKQIQEIFKSNKPDVNIDLSSVIDTANQRINYGELARIYKQYQDVITEANRSTAEKIISEGQKTAEANVTTWEKELAKAKSFEEQRTDIIQRETQRRAEIIKSYEYTPEQKEEKIAQSERIQREEIYKIDVEEFKAGDDYIKVFQDVENVATSSLDRIETELKKLIANGKDLDATNLKTYVDALEKIQDEKEKRDPLKAITNGVRDYIDAIRERKQAETELKAAQTEYDAHMPIVQGEIDMATQDKDTADADVVAAQQQLLLIQQQMSVLRAQEVVDSTALAALREQEIAAENNLVSAQLRQNSAAVTLTNAENKRVSLTKRLQTSQKKVTNAQDKQKKAVKNLADGLNQVNEKVGSMSDALSAVKDLLGDAAADGTVLGGAIDGGIQALETFQKLMAVIIALQTVYNIETESNPWIAIAAAVLAVAGILTGAIKASKIEKANEEIEHQQEILDKLERSYKRLQDLSDKFFGADYIRNYNQQLNNLEAQIEAKKKQLAAEESKGKDADDDKKKGYQDDIKDLEEEYADMVGKISEHFLGTDLASAARDFAKAWLEAYKEFGNTADAMSEKFHEMIENMVVEGALAKVMERALEPAFKMIDNMKDVDFYSESFWKQVVDTAEQGVKDADYGAQTMMKFLEQAGISIRDLGGEMTGISRDIAGASEESINGLAAGINTQNFYMSHIPGIAANVAAIRAAIGAGDVPVRSAAAAGWTDWQQQAMDNYNAIVRNTAETVVECRRAANACEEATETLNRAFRVKGATQGLNVFLNS